MNERTDQELLTAYATRRDEVAFAELVRRQVDLVHSAALRMVRDAEIAREVSQAVFLALARDSQRLTARPVLLGWLHVTTRNLAAKAVRSEVRRRAREQEAVAMETSSAPNPAPAWEEIAPHLDAALAELGETDREAVMLRYFQGRSAREIGVLQGLSAEAAQKRIARAMERLRAIFQRQGVALGAGALAAAISHQAVQAAPIGLAASIATSIAQSALPTVATASIAHTFAMTSLQKTFVTTLVLSAISLAVNQTWEARSLRRQLQTLREDAAVPHATAADSGTANNPASVQTASVTPMVPRDPLRNDATVPSPRATAPETEAATSGKGLPEGMARSLQGLITQLERSGREELTRSRLPSLKLSLSLSEAQERAIGEILASQLERRSQRWLDLISGKLTPAEARRVADTDPAQDELRAMLTPEQEAAYPGYLQFEKLRQAEASSTSEARKIAHDYDLSVDQEMKLRANLHEFNLKDTGREAAWEDFIQAMRRGTPAMEAATQWERRTLEAKTALLERILPPEGVEAFRRQQLARIEATALTALQALKIESPGEPGR